MNQLDLFEALEPALPLLPLRPTRWEVLPITRNGETTEPKVNASYSALSLSTSGKVLRPFRFRSYLWVNTGAAFFRGDADFECYRIVPAEDYDGTSEPRTYHDHDLSGPQRDELGGYHGMKAKRGAHDIVLIGPPVVFALKAATI